MRRGHCAVLAHSLGHVPHVNSCPHGEFALLPERFTRRFPVVLRLLSSNVLVAFLTFVNGVILARALGADGRGAFAAITVWATAIASLALLGTHIHLARKAGEPDADVRSVYRAAYRLLVPLSLLGIAAYLAVLWLFVRSSITLPWAMIGLGALMVPGSMIGAMQIQIELGRRAYATFNFARLSFAIAMVLPAVALWMAGLDELALFVVAMLVATYACAALTWVQIRQSIGQTRQSPPSSRLALGRALRDSRGFALIALFSALTLQADKLLLSGLFPAAALGYFVVASSIAQLQNIVGEAFAQPFFARMTAFAGADEIDIDWLAQRLRQTVLVAATMSAGSMIFLPPLVPFLYGPEFVASADLLLILLPALAIRIVTRPYEELIRGLGHVSLLFWILGAIVAFMLVGIMIAAQSGTVRTVAWAVMLGNAAGLLAALVISRRLFGIPLAKALLPRPADVRNMIDQLASIVASGAR